MEDLARGNCGRACRSCGSTWFQVVNTWVLANGLIRRKRACRRCGKDFFLTVEAATNGNRVDPAGESENRLEE